MAHLSELARQKAQQVAVIDERNRLAREIHDTLAQGFTGVIMQLEAAKGAMARSDLVDLEDRIERASDLARSSLGEARRSVRALRPSPLRDGTLCGALGNFLKTMTDGTELIAEFVVEGEPRQIPPEWEEGLLRIAQEALTNTLKHAQARRFSAKFSFAAEEVTLQLVDDGRGFDPEAEHDGFGLLGMQERVAGMGGQFLVRSKPSQVTEIVVTLKQAGAEKMNNVIDPNPSLTFSLIGIASTK